MTAVRLVNRFRTSARRRETPEFKQHGEVAHFLRDFVRHDGQRRHDAEVYIGEERRSDQYAVQHVVQGVTHQHQRAARFLAGLFVLMSVVVVITHRVLGAVVIMAMAPEQEFLENKEQRNAGDERDAHFVHVLHARGFDRVRDQRQQRRA